MRKTTVSFYFSCGLIVLIVFSALFGGLLKPHGISEKDQWGILEQVRGGHISQVSPPLAPNSTFLLGTDHRGYDILSLLLNGLKYTLGIAILLILLRFLIALPWGLWTGTTGRGAGFLRSMQWMLSAVPAFIFLYPPLAGLYNGLGLGLSNQADSSFMLLFTLVYIGLITFIGVFPLAYQLAERARYFNDKLYVDVSLLMGGSNRHRIIRHILPNMRVELLFTFLSEFVQVLFLMGQLAVFKVVIGGSDMLQWDDRYLIDIPRTGEWMALFAYGSEYIRQHPWIMLSAGISLLFLILSVQLFLYQLKKRVGGSMAG